jgi:hypothetical protein
MKFSPDHRPLTMTGVAMLAGFVVFLLLFFLVSSRIPGAGGPSTAIHDARTDSSATRMSPAGARDSSAALDLAKTVHVAGLTESTRASLLAASSALEHRRGGQQGKGPAQLPRIPSAGTPPVGNPAAQKDKPQRPHTAPGGTAVRPAPPQRSAGTVTMGPLQWIGGGKRKKLYGALPPCPMGLASTVHIKVEAVVAPDGHVRSVRQGQKGNARCEDVAIRAVERWRFERLARHIPQRDQRCVVTFSFSVN